MVLIFFILLISICILVGMFGILFRIKFNLFYEKYSSFECGFNIMIKSRMPFSMRFFIVCLIFLVFDVELVLIFPFIFSISYLNYLNNILLIILFIVVLMVGLLHEWNYGGLEWRIFNKIFYTHTQ